MDELVRKIIIFVVLIGYLLWKRYHVKKLKKNVIDIKKEIISALYVGVAVIVLVGGINIWGVFVEVYIAIPIAIALLYLLKYKENGILGTYLILKGLYYAGLAIHSTFQYFMKYEKIEVLALGFTLALAIFESFTALIDGSEKLFFINKEKKK